MAYPFRNLVFEGGGVKGIAYVGATEVLEKKGILPNITRVVGTSAGAINALLVGLNDERKAALAEWGRTHTRKYFDWYDDPKNTPATGRRRRCGKCDARSLGERPRDAECVRRSSARGPYDQACSSMMLPSGSVT